MGGRVLVVDDEPRIRTVLRAYLEAEGYEVAEAGTAAEALALATGAGGAAPALVLLDLGLPDADGLDVLRRVRQVSEVPVIVVTARAEEVDTLVGLTVGADDYVAKPFSPREVVARVRTVLRRTGADRPPPERVEPAPPGPALRVGDLAIDEERHEITYAGRAVALSALEFDLLAALARSPGRVFSRAQLLEKVWGYDFYGDERVVDVHIRSLRKALGDEAAAPRVIGTVRGVGYKLLAAPAAGSGSSS